MPAARMFAIRFKRRTASKNTFTKETSTFKGWAVEAKGAVQYTDMSSIQSIVNFMAMENKTELTLYAVWEDTAAGGETVEP